ncbi:MAG: sulfatase-like hydrolase/transferase [Saprospiraceae bacterium]|nr:sulfatase-like hydrolase/transferase [Saprospiraceae bacterium]
MTKCPVHYRLLSILLLVLVLFAGCRPAKSSRPNILLIMTDQQPVSCVGAYGNSQIKTPYLDQLAEEGHLMRNFYIAAFPCSPSRASLLSGRYLHHHNVSTNNVRMDPSIPVMGQILGAAGYRTGYFGKAHLGGSMYVGRTGGDGIDYLHTPGETPDPVGDAIRDYWYHERIETDSGWSSQRHEGGPGEDQAQLGFDQWKGGWKHYKDWLIQHGQEAFARVAGNHDDFQSAPEGEHMFSQLGPEYHMAHFFTDQTEAFIQENSKKPLGSSLVLFWTSPPGSTTEAMGHSFFVGRNKSSSQFSR